MNFSGGPPDSLTCDAPERCGSIFEHVPDLHSALNVDGLDTHALLLLYLMPEANHSDADAKTTGAVEILRDVQSRLSTGSAGTPFNKDTLATIYATLAAIRFGPS